MFLRCNIDIHMLNQAIMASISFQVKLLLKIEINKSKLYKSSYVCNISITIRILDTYNVTPMLETKRERVSPNAPCFGDSLDHFLSFFCLQNRGHLDTLCLQNLETRHFEDKIMDVSSFGDILKTLFFKSVSGHVLETYQRHNLTPAMSGDSMKTLLDTL